METSFASEAVAASEELTSRELQMLEFERRWWRDQSSKERAIQEVFSCSATRYYQCLNRLLSRPEAVSFDPILVRRLQRQRASAGHRGAIAS